MVFTYRSTETCVIFEQQQFMSDMMQWNKSSCINYLHVEEDTYYYFYNLCNFGCSVYVIWQFLWTVFTNFSSNVVLYGSSSWSPTILHLYIYSIASYTQNLHFFWAKRWLLKHFMIFQVVTYFKWINRWVRLQSKRKRFPTGYSKSPL